MAEERFGFFSRINASHMVGSVWGVFAGLGAFRHGIGEVLQGNATTGGLFIESWATGPIAEQMGGEPAITLIPNFLYAGIVILALSLVVIIWSAAFMHRNNGGRGLIYLSLGMLLLGGGVGPPVIGLIAGWAGTGVRSSFPWWSQRLTGNLRRAMAIVYPWLISVCFVASFGLFIVSFPLVYAVEIANADSLFFSLFLLTAVTLILTTVAGFAHDLYCRPLTVTNR